MVALLDDHFNAISWCRPGRSTANGRRGERAAVLAAGRGPASQGNPLVAFDLYNEPHDISDMIWRYGGTVSWKGVNLCAAGMQQMYDTVRATGAQNLVFVTGNSWGNLWPSTAPLAGSNIVYAVHATPAPARRPPNCSNGARTTPASSSGGGWWPGASFPVVSRVRWPNQATARTSRPLSTTRKGKGGAGRCSPGAAATWGQFCLLATAGPGTNYEPRPTGMPALAAFAGT